MTGRRWGIAPSPHVEDGLALTFESEEGNVGGSLYVEEEDLDAIAQEIDVRRTAGAPRLSTTERIAGLVSQLEGERALHEADAEALRRVVLGIQAAIEDSDGRRREIRAQRFTDIVEGVKDRDELVELMNTIRHIITTGTRIRTEEPDLITERAIHG